MDHPKQPTGRDPLHGTPPSPKQREVLDAMRAYIASHEGHSPTMAELAAILGVNKVTIFEHMKGLERRGLVENRKNKARSHFPVDICPACGRSLVDHAGPGEKRDG